jgi:hypothetical protein
MPREPPETGTEDADVGEEGLPDTGGPQYLATRNPSPEENPPVESDVLMGYYRRNPSGVLPIVVVIVGPRGSGKSKIAVPLVRHMVSKAGQIVCAGFGSPQLANDLGVPWHQLRAANARGAEKAAQFFRTVENSEGNFVFVLDDSDAVWREPARYIAMYEFIRNNRAFGQGSLIITHSPGATNKNSVLCNAQLILFSCQSEPNAIDYCRRYMKADFPRAEERIRSLPRYRFLVWAPELPGKHKYVGEAWVDSAGRIQLAPRWQNSSIPSTTEDEKEATPDGSADIAGGPSPTGGGPTPAPPATTSDTTSGG